MNLPHRTSTSGESLSSTKVVVTYLLSSILLLPEYLRLPKPGVGRNGGPG